MPSSIDPASLPAYAKAVLSALEEAGFEAWIVGGWVRDSLRGDPAHDVDITTIAPWQMTERVLEAAGIFDVRAKSIGSSNTGNMALATIEALKQLTTVEEAARKRGKTPEEILG